MPHFIHNNGELLEGTRYKSDPERYTQIAESTYHEIENYYEQNDIQLKELVNNYQGEEVHILGTGKSIDRIDPKFFDDKITLGVNYAFKSFPLTLWLMVDDFYDVSHVAVRQWLQSKRDTTTFASRAIMKHFRPKCWMPDFLVSNNDMGPVSDITKGLYWSKSCVQAAIDLARYLGFTTIYLHGVDYDGGYMEPRKLTVEKVNALFQPIADECKAQKVTVYNCNPDSNVSVFPIKNLGELQFQSYLVKEEPSPKNGVAIDFDEKAVVFSVDGKVSVVRFDDFEQLKNGKALLKSVQALAGKPEFKDKI